MYYCEEEERRWLAVREEGKQKKAEGKKWRKRRESIGTAMMPMMTPHSPTTNLEPWFELYHSPLSPTLKNFK